MPTDIGELPIPEISTPTPSEIASTETDVFPLYINTIIDTSAQSVHTSAEINNSAENGVISSEEQHVLTAELNEADRFLYEALDEADGIIHPCSSSITPKENKKSIHGYEEKVELKYEPLDTNNLEENTKKTTALLIEYVREDSGFLEVNNPTVKALQNYLDRMKDPNAPPTRVLVAINDMESNAYSLPDGTIIVNQALINEMDTIEEIVAILGHEQVHFEKLHHKKTMKDWYESDDPVQILRQFISNNGLQRMHEYQADLAMIAKLDSLGFDTLVFESAIRKIGRGDKKEKISTQPEGISLIHGTNTDRALNTFYAHAVVDFASSIQGEDSHHPIPSEWKRQIDGTLFERLSQIKPDTEWQKLLEDAEPLVLKNYTYSLVSFCTGQRRNYSPSEGIRRTNRRNFQKLEKVFSLFDARLANSNLSDEEKRRALILGLTQGIGFQLRDWYRIDKEKILSTPFDTFKANTNLFKRVSSSDFTLDGISSFLNLHNSQESYKILGFPKPEKNFPSDTLGNNKYPNLPGYFIRKGKIQLELKDGIRPYKVATEKLIAHLHSLSEIIEKQYDKRTGDQWFSCQVSSVINNFIENNAKGIDIGRNRLIKDTTKLLTYLKDTYGFRFSSNILIHYADSIAYTEFGTNHKIAKTALETFINTFRSIDKNFQSAFDSKNQTLLTEYLKNSPVEFNKQIANLRARNKLTTEQSKFLLDIVKENIDKVPILDVITVTDESQKELEKIGKSLDISGISPEIQTKYRQVKYCLESITILTANTSILERIAQYQTYLNSEELQPFLKSLPISLLDDLCREITYEGIDPRHHQLNRKGISWKTENKFDLITPTYEFKEENGFIQIREGFNDMADRLTSIPVFNILRDKLISEIPPSSQSISTVMDKYDYYRHLLETAYQKNDSFWGSSLGMAEQINPITNLLLDTLTHFSITETSPQESIKYYQALRKYLPNDFDNAKILSNLSEKILYILPFDEALQFLETEAEENRFDFAAINRFVENKVHTKQDFDKCKATVSRAVDNIMSEPKKAIGALTIADKGLEIASKDIDMASLLEKMILHESDDSKLRNEIAPLYWSALVEDTPWTGERGYKIIPWNGTTEIVGPAAHTFHTFNEVFTRLYTLTDMQKTLLLRKLLLSQGGILNQPKYHEKASEMVVSRLEKDPTLTPLFKNVLKSSMRAGDSVRMFTPLANALLPMFLIKPKMDGSNTLASSEIYRKIHKDENLITKVGSELGRGWSRNAVQSILDKSSEEVAEEVLARNPSTRSTYALYQKCLDHLKQQSDTQEFIGTKEQNGKIPPVEAILKVGESLGPVGVRFLQVLGQYIDLPPEYEERFRSVYDSMEGQSKYTAFSIIERLAKTDETTRRFMDEELVSIDEKIGGGSINTAFKITTKDSEGQTHTEVLKVKNPNAERFVMETIIQARLIVKDLMENNPKEKSNYEIAERLLNTIEEWVLGDIRDSDFMIMDKTFSLLHDGYATSSGIITKVPSAKQPNNLFIKREAYVEGKTLNKYLTQDLSGEQLTNAQRFVSATAEGFARQLSIPAFYEEKDKPVFQVLSDIHPGNIIVSTDQKTVYSIDRNYYLKLYKEDIDFIKTAMGNTPPQDKLGAMVQYFLNQKENLTLGLDHNLVTQQIFNTFAKDQIINTIRGKGSETNSLKLMFKFLHELDKRKVTVPLRVRILMKDLDAVNKMLQKVQLTSFSSYIS